MVKEEVKKTAKLNEFDRRVLMVYSDVLLETGEKTAAEATAAKVIHKNKAIKV